MMIEVRNESDLRNWFKINYKKLGFEKIVKSNTKKCPDFIMLENGQKINVELELKSSNFLLHQHPYKEVDKVICAIEDIKLKIPTIKINNIKLIKFNQKAPYSLQELIFPLFKKEAILTTTDISKHLNVSKGASEKALMELVLDGKVERIKKLGVNLWVLK